MSGLDILTPPTEGTGTPCASWLRTVQHLFLDQCIEAGNIKPAGANLAKNNALEAWVKELTSLYELPELKCARHYREIGLRFSAALEKVNWQSHKSPESIAQLKGFPRYKEACDHGIFSPVDAKPLASIKSYGTGGKKKPGYGAPTMWAFDGDESLRYFDKVVTKSIKPEATLGFYFDGEQWFLILQIHQATKSYRAAPSRSLDAFDPGIKQD